MGKKRISTLGSEAEAEEKAKKAVKLEQKKLREGKAPVEVKKTTDQKHDQQPEDPEAKSLAEYEAVQAKLSEATTQPTEAATSTTKKVRIRSSSYKAAKQKINLDKTYPIAEALELLKQVSLTKFDPTVELHIVLKSGTFNQNVELPFSTGKTKRIAIADDATMAKIEAGKIDFDVLLASPASMGKLVKFAKVLGPKGLMPNPKNGTVVPDPEAAAKKMASTISVLIKTEKTAPVIHTIIGKLSQKPTELTKNIDTILAALSQHNPKKIVIKSTMSPAIKLLI